ncbi:MAG: paraquat-inducible protein A, partial [Melioribacteraceae bacterium]
FLLILFTKTYTKPIITLVVLIALHFLILGLLLPMIDIDARISTMEFNLLGETISFHNQVLYFKSKSILEMANVMLTHDKLKIIIVGILVLVFSVIFPFTKLFSTILLLYKEKFASNKFIDFMVFKSGKWSMADVMVVAIFMSYIGFSGIISNQLSQLENITNDLSIVTTNYSELQSGFFFFLTFVLASIVVSQILYNKFFIITRTSRIRLSPRQVNP